MRGRPGDLNQFDPACEFRLFGAEDFQQAKRRIDARNWFGLPVGRIKCVDAGPRVRPPSRQKAHGSTCRWLGRVVIDPRRSSRRPNCIVRAVSTCYSRMDEAWQVLHHMRTVNNPLAVQTLAYILVFSTFRSHMVRAAESELILGAKPFTDFSFSARLVHTLLYSVFVLTLLIAIPAVAADFGWLTLDCRYCFHCLHVRFDSCPRELGARPFNGPGAAPIRWYGRLIGAVMGVPISVLTYFVRRNAWPILLAMVMGLEGYRFELPGIAWKPETEHANVTYEDLLDSVVQRALDKRSAWVARHLGDFSQTFSRLAVTAADITLLLRMIEEDQTLITPHIIPTTSASLGSRTGSLTKDDPFLLDHQRRY